MKSVLRKRFGVISLLAVGLFSLALGIVFNAQWEITPHTDAEEFWQESATTVPATPSITQNSFVALAKKVNPAVVNISTTQVVNGHRKLPNFKSPFEDFFGDEFDRFFRDMPQKEFKTQSLGSGFIINKEGFILTNNHVVERADEIVVSLSSGNEYVAKVVGRDPKTDIALIKIDNDGDLPIVGLGNSDSLEIGEWVVAIGNPFGYRHTVTAGIVSGKGRFLSAGPYDDFIQTDASINPGNSGGPLLNIRGEVIGINTAIISGGQGMGFAIPINMAKAILIQLKEKGQVIRGWLGVGIQEVTAELAQSFGLKNRTGALISSVREGDPAADAGIEPGDIIVEFDGKEIKDHRDLPWIVSSTSPGKKVEVKIIRNGEEKKLTAVVAEMEEEGAPAKRETADKEERFGLSVHSITPEISRQFRLKDSTGVVVTGVVSGSIADRAGIRTKDVIRQINGLVINDLKGYNSVINKIEKGDVVRFLIIRNGNALFIALRVRD
ncbi:MAG: DegQ family serine endoprotease [Thermodesulfobacteriota bacterium]